MVALSLGQAYPTYFLQGYDTVPAVPGAPFTSQATHAALTSNYISDTYEVSQAKQEFMVAFRQATNGLLYELAPAPVQDTREVREAKEEFFRIFDKALNGLIETSFTRDTEEVRQRKAEFFGTFDSAVSNLLDTVEENYLEDTAEVKAAKQQFRAAYADAEAGKIGAQYIEDTAEVKAAKERFFRFFDFAVQGLLYKLAPVPGHNQIPAEIADFYIKDEPEVAAAKREFDQLYRDALGGDVASALALTVLADHDNNYGGAVEELEITLKQIEDSLKEDESPTLEVEEARSSSKDESSSIDVDEESLKLSLKSDEAVISSLLDVLELGDE